VMLAMSRVDVWEEWKAAIGGEERARVRSPPRLARRSIVETT